MCLDNLDYLPEIVENLTWLVKWNELAESLKDYINPMVLLEIVEKIKK